MRTCVFVLVHLTTMNLSADTMELGVELLRVGLIILARDSYLFLPLLLMAQVRNNEMCISGARMLVQCVNTH